MDYNRIEAALRKARNTHYLLIGTGVLNDVGHVLKQAFGRQSAVVVADDNTYAVAGKAVFDRLCSAGRTVEEPLVFPGIPPSSLFLLYNDGGEVVEGMSFPFQHVHVLRPSRE